MNEPPHPPPTPAPFIDEVRERRRKLFAACGYSLRALGVRIRELEREHPDKVVNRRQTQSRSVPGT